MITLRDFQNAAVDAVFREWLERQSTLIVQPTGTGKTVTFAAVIARRIRETGGRAIVIVHREELVTQAVDKIERVTGIVPAVEMGDFRADASLYDRAQVVVATVQTLNASRGGNKRIGKFNPADFTLLVQDECHHGTASTWVAVQDHFKSNPNLRVLGVTATPDRADEAALGRVFESVAFNYELPDAIDDGWLVPVRQRMVHVDGIDLTNVRTTAGDLNGAELAAIMERERVLHEVAGPTIELAAGRKTLVFAASVAHAEMLCEIFNRHRPRSAAWLCGKTPKDQRRAMLAAYARGEIQILVNVGVLCEGFDDPGVEVVVMARLTESRCLYSQMAGRATRPLPGVVDRWELADDRVVAIKESEKPFCEIIDFVGNSGRHKLVTTADILGGKYEDDVVARAKAKVEAFDGAVDMALALREAADELAAAEREREKAAEAARRAGVRARAAYTTEQVDPFDVFDRRARQDQAWDTAPPMTDRMRAALEKNGLDPDGMDYAEAKRHLGEITRRRIAGECTLKQAKVLRKHGLPADVPMATAKEWLDRIAANGWRLPHDLSALRVAPSVPAAVTAAPAQTRDRRIPTPPPAEVF